MASCITSTFGNSQSPQLRLTVTQESSTATTATLKWVLEYVIHGYPVSTSVAKSYSVDIGGTTVKTGTFSINGISETTTIASGTTVINKTSSSQSVLFSCSMAFNLTWNGVYSGTRTASGSISVAAKTSYKVTYNANGGSGAPSSQTKWHGTTLKLSSSKPTRSGYSFMGWATSSGGTAAYQPGGNYTANASVTLYAVWGVASYTITYNANGGTGAPNSQTKTHGQTVTLSGIVPTRERYSFLGWGISKSSTTVSYAPGSTYSANASITLYAIWVSDYTLPRVNNLSVDRCDELGKMNDEGTYALVSFGWECDEVPTTVKIEWRKATESVRAGLYMIPIGEDQTSGSVEQVLGTGGIDIDSEYVFTVTITDSGGTTMSSMRLGTEFYVMDIMPGGQGISFGCPATALGDMEIAYNLTVRTADGSRKSIFQIPSGTTGLDKVSLQHRMYADGAWSGYGRLLSTLNTRILLWSGTWSSGSITVENINKFSMYILYTSSDLTECMIGIRSLATSTDITCFGMTPSDNVLKLNSAKLRLNGTTLTRVAPRIWTITGTAITTANETMTIYRIEGLL